MINIIKSKLILKTIFNNINYGRKLNKILYNKRLQKDFNINIIDIQFFSGRYKITEKDGKVKEYNNYNDNLIYEGEYLNGKRNGKGKEYNFDGDIIIYEGEYLKGKKHGKGKEYDYEGNLIFEGEYKEGIKWEGNIREYDGDILIFQIECH